MPLERLFPRRRPQSSRFSPGALNDRELEAFRSWLRQAGVELQGSSARSQRRNTMPVMNWFSVNHTGGDKTGQELVTVIRREGTVMAFMWWMLPEIVQENLPTTHDSETVTLSLNVTGVGQVDTHAEFQPVTSLTNNAGTISERRGLSMTPFLLIDGSLTRKGETVYTYDVAFTNQTAFEAKGLLVELPAVSAYVASGGKAAVPTVRQD